MANTAPKPDAERVRRNAPTFGWVDLPAEGRDGPIPDLGVPPVWLNEFGGWPVATRAAWKKLWESPQATQWAQDGSTLLAWAALHAKSELEGPQPSRVAEMRQHEDRHGLNPRALLGLRWRIVGAADEAPVPRTQRAKATGIDRRSRLLKVVTDGESKGAGKAKG